MIPVVVLVVAKAPVPGQAKTRLAASVGDQAAADIAAAALLDTLDAVAEAPVAARVVALTGDLDDASAGDEIRSRSRRFHGGAAAWHRLRRAAGQRARRRRRGHRRAPGPADRNGYPTGDRRTDRRMRAGTTRRRRGAWARSGRRLVGARRDRCRDGRLPARDSDVAIRHRRCNAGGTWRHWCKCEPGSHAGGCGHRR